MIEKALVECPKDSEQHYMDVLQDFGYTIDTVNLNQSNGLSSIIFQRDTIMENYDEIKNYEAEYRVVAGEHKKLLDELKAPWWCNLMIGIGIALMIIGIIILIILVIVNQNPGWLLAVNPCPLLGIALIIVSNCLKQNILKNMKREIDEKYKHKKYSLRANARILIK